MKRQQEKFDIKNVNYGSLDSDESRYMNSKLINKFDAKFIRWLVRMHNELNMDNLNMNDIGDLIQNLKHMYSDQSENYTNAMLYPEYAVNARIPRIIPVKACTFQAVSEYRFNANPSGLFTFIFNPVAVLPDGSSTSFFLNNYTGLTGNATSAFFIATDIGYAVSPIYSDSCLVSCALQVEVQCNSNTNNGTVVLGVIHDPVIGNASTGANVNTLARYGNFSLARTGFFNDSVNVNICPAIRSIYFPIDSSFEVFLNSTISNVKTGFAWVCTGVGLSPSVTIIVRVTANWESLPDPAFVNVIPSSLGPTYESSEEKSRSIKKVQKNPIKAFTPELAEEYARKSEGFMDNMSKLSDIVLPNIREVTKLIDGINNINLSSEAHAVPDEVKMAATALEPSLSSFIKKTTPLSVFQFNPYSWNPLK